MRTLLLSTALLLGVATAGRAAPALGDKRPKWEYAELTFRTMPSRPAGADADGKTTAAVPAYIAIRWVTGAGEVEVKGWEELAEKLKVPGFKNGTLSFKKIQILNFLGGEGWELMDQQGPTSSTVVRERNPGLADRGPGGGFAASAPTTWLLKRRVP